MDDEEAEALLRGLRASLGEFGHSSFALPRHALPEDRPDTNVRSELRRVLEEYEAVLVDAPTMAARTMKLLGARIIAFKPDPDDAGDRRDGAADGAGVKLTLDDLAEWIAIANQARETIADLRERIVDQAR